MQLLIRDTNIFIDLEEGELMQFLFLLPNRIGVPDLFSNDELRRGRSHYK